MMLRRMLPSVRFLACMRSGIFFFKVSCGLLDGSIVPRQGSKGCKLCSTVHHAHLRMNFRNVMRQVDDVVVFFHNCSSLVSSNLLIAFFRSGTFLVVETLQDGILAKALLDAEYGFLHLAFLFERGLFFVPLSFKFLVVGEEVELDGW